MKLLPGFSSTSGTGKAVTVLNDSLTKVKKRFENADSHSNVSNICQDEGIVLDSNNLFSDMKILAGLSFASGTGKVVTVSNDSLTNVKTLLADSVTFAAQNPLLSRECKGDPGVNQLSENPLFNPIQAISFNTASGKCIESSNKVKLSVNSMESSDFDVNNVETLLAGCNAAVDMSNENVDKIDIFDKSDHVSKNNSDFKKVRFEHVLDENYKCFEEMTKTSVACNKEFFREEVGNVHIFSPDLCVATPTGPKRKRIRNLDFSAQSSESCKLENTSGISLENSFEYFGSQIDFSLAHEISESTAAFLADDECDWTLKSPAESTICPSMSKLKQLGASTPLLTSTPEVAINRHCRKRLALSDSTFSPLSKGLKKELDNRIEAFKSWRKGVLKNQLDVIEKKRGREKPMKGIYLSAREQQKLDKLDVALRGERPKSYSYQQLLAEGLDKRVIDVTSSNAVDFCFDLKETCFESYEEKCIALGCLLIPNADFNVGIAEISQCFLSLPGVDPSLVPETWVKNHYRWIVWKLASYEKSFPHIFANRCLTVNNLLKQLQYRHDREISLAQRPAIRKILERDDSPFKLIALCVADIKKLDLDHQADGNYELELTDGWYSVWAATDSEMNKLVLNSCVKIGTKLVIHGAQLIDSDQPTDPLQAIGASGVRLKICTNSTRRAIWHCRLGFISRAENIPASIRNILPNGGQISLLTANVARIYPMLHMSKDSNGKNVFRSTKAESLEADSVDNVRTEKAEQLYQQVLNEVEAKYKPKTNVGKRLTRRSIRNLNDITQPEVLYEMMEQSADPLYIQNQLSGEQVKMVLEYRRELMEKIQREVTDTVKKKLEEMLPQRKVTTILKVRLVDVNNGTDAVLTLWRPSDDHCSLMKENSVFRFKFITANGKRDKTLQLSTTRQTRYERVVTTDSSCHYKRKLSCISEVDEPTFKPVFGEFDTVGFVVEKKSTPSGVNIVYLSDLEKNLLSITFWTSIKMFCKEEVFTEGAIIGACNLQWRLGSVSWRVPTCYATELSTFSNHPKQSYLLPLYTQYKQHFSSEFGVKTFVEECKDKLFRLLAKRESGGRADLSSYSTPSGTAGLSRVRTPSSINAKTPPNLLNSPVVSTPLQKRLKKLSSYASPPPLTPLPINIVIPHHTVTKDFKSPFRISESVVSSQPSSSQSSSSPPLSLE